MKFAFHPIVHRRFTLCAAITATLLITAVASPVRAAVTLINFDDGAVNVDDTLANQYASQGAVFSSGTGGASGIGDDAGDGFNTITDMTIVSSTGMDIGGGVAAPISGLLLHSYNGWLGEDGDAVFRIDFSAPITGFSIAFGGVSDIASSGFYAVDGTNTAFQSAFTTSTGTSTVMIASFSKPATSIVVTEGDFFDWVGVDNIRFTTAVPEPSTYGAFAVGALALSGVVWRRRRVA